MPDPAITVLLIAALLLALTLIGWFKNLESIWKEGRAPLVTGVVSGSLALLAGRVLGFEAAAIGLLLTLAALYVRLTGSESEPSDGMVLGAITGTAAATPFLFANPHSLLRFTQCILAGGVAGYGTTFALTHVRNRGRQAIVDVLTALAAVLVAVSASWAANAATARGIELWQVAALAAAIVALVLVATVFAQWPAIRTELRDEARLGFIEREDVRPTAHPILRLGRAGWHDRNAHREFVRIATRIALRKRQQRHRSEEAARIYQLEVIKLRMELQEMARIDRLMRLRSEGEQLAR